MSFAPPKKQNAKNRSNAKFAIRRNNKASSTSKCVAASQDKKESGNSVITNKTNSLKFPLATSQDKKESRNSVITNKTNSLKFPLATSKVPVRLESKTGDHSKKTFEVLMNESKKNTKENPKGKTMAGLNSRVVYQPKEDKTNVNLSTKKIGNFNKSSLTEGNAMKNVSHTASKQENESKKFKVKDTILLKTSLPNKNISRGISMGDLNTHHSPFTNRKKLTGERIYGSAALTKTKIMKFKTASTGNITNLNWYERDLKDMKMISKNNIGAITKSPEISMYGQIKTNKKQTTFQTKETVSRRSISHDEFAKPLKEYENAEFFGNEETCHSTNNQILVNEMPFQSGLIAIENEKCTMLSETKVLVETVTTNMSSEIECFRILPDFKDSERLKKKQYLLNKQILDIVNKSCLKYGVTNNEQFNTEQTVDTEKGMCDPFEIMFQESSSEDSQETEILPECINTSNKKYNARSRDIVEKEVCNTDKFDLNFDNHENNQNSETIFAVKEQFPLSRKVEKTALSRRELIEAEIDEKVKILKAQYLHQIKKHDLKNNKLETNQNTRTMPVVKEPCPLSKKVEMTTLTLRELIEKDVDEKIKILTAEFLQKTKKKRAIPSLSVKKKNPNNKLYNMDLNCSQSTKRTMNHRGDARNATVESNTTKESFLIEKSVLNEHNEKKYNKFYRTVYNMDTGELKNITTLQATKSPSPKSNSNENCVSSPKISKIPRSLNYLNSPSSLVSQQSNMLPIENRTHVKAAENQLKAENLRVSKEEINAFSPKQTLSNNADGVNLNNSSTDYIHEKNEGLSLSLLTNASAAKNGQSYNKEYFNALNVSPGNKNDNEMLCSTSENNVGIVKNANVTKGHMVERFKDRQLNKVQEMRKYCYKILTKSTDEKKEIVSSENQSEIYGSVEYLSEKRVANTRMKAIKGLLSDKMLIVLVLSFFIFMCAFISLIE